MTTARQPTLFIPHGGGPCFFMEWDPPHLWDKMAEYLRGIATALPAKPRAIVLISGHWEEAEFTVQTHPNPELVYDYSGFPPHTYKLQYPAPGAPELAAQVQGLLQAAGIASKADAQRGFDHGVFIPLKVAFPAADIPVIQLSLKKGLSPAQHMAAGKALEPLRDEGVLIVGSGMSFHNMRTFMRVFGGQNKPDVEAHAFDVWLSAAVTAPSEAERTTMLVEWANAPAAHYAHPREEHLLPLMVAAGAAGADIGRKVLHDLSLGVDISAFQFG